jgi:hypothetical protein
MLGNTCNFNETQAVIKFFFFLQGKAPKEIHAILTKTLGEPVPCTEKAIERLPFFFRHKSHYCRGDLAGQTNF